MEKLLKAAAVLLIVFCLLACSSAVPARADSEGAGTVTASALIMRSEPSTSSSVVTCLPRGTVVVLTGKSDGWYEVAYKGSTGYMSSDYLDVSSTADGSFGSGTVTGNLVNIRSGPSTSNSVVGTRNKGDTLDVTGVSDNWYKVSLSGSTGYIRSDYLRLGSGTGSSSGSSTNVKEASGTGTINAMTVRLRSGPSTSYSILGTYDKGTTMTVTGDAGDWYKVSCNGTEGYVYKTYLTVGGSGSSSGSSVTDMSDTSATVISDVHFRKGPDTSYSSIQVLGAGTGVTITGQTDKWYRVEYNGTEGYVFKTYLTTGSYTAVSSSSSSAGARIVAKAKEYLGVPYVYGGTSPSGFDCSGFVYYVYRQCGYSITRTATTQNRDGRQVSRSELQPGDIVIFYNSAKTAIGHSAIYIGNGQFIHASSSGGKVMITSLSASYYDTHFYSARRVVG